MKQIKELRKRKTGGKQVKQTKHNKQAKTSKTNHNKQAKTGETDKPQQTNSGKTSKTATTANRHAKTSKTDKPQQTNSAVSFKPRHGRFSSLLHNLWLKKDPNTYRGQNNAIY